MTMACGELERREYVLAGRLCADKLRIGQQGLHGLVIPVLRREMEHRQPLVIEQGHVGPGAKVLEGS